MSSLVIGSEVTPNKNPTSTFLFRISQMSGDADSYETESFQVEPKRSVDFADLIECIKNLPHGYYTTTQSIVKAVNEKLSKEVINNAVSNGHLEDWISQIVGYDVTCEGNLAILDSYEIFWFDERGVKFNVEFVK